MIKIFGKTIENPDEKNELILKFDEIINTNKIVVDAQSKNVKIFVDNSDYLLIDASGNKKGVKKLTAVIPKDYLKNALVCDNFINIIIQIGDKEYGFKILCEDIDKLIGENNEYKEENDEYILGLLKDDEHEQDEYVKDDEEQDTVIMKIVPKQIPRMGLVITITNIKNNKSKTISVTTNEPFKIRLKNENKYKLKIKRRFIGIPKELSFTARPGVSFSVDGLGFDVLIQIT